ncbi:hypothetical protein H6G51_01080 [Limnothrix sp. FACHB-708]|uniref:DUF3226 domain-containing protein n=1 Tax=unclassified Limnothrix TaxID=2632864 RepID=UPI0016873FAD|nr:MULTISPECIES: DUF3226 domain-containing protein [unclassified Limnothrix]MBD2551861.1 hypothetical protein [Limnothrix sp. FACHB-708]MBD2589540.1 hypothetical protein [Limnothrix sp. FACHB-406]
MSSTSHRSRVLFVEGSSDKTIIKEILNIYLPHWKITRKRSGSSQPQIDIQDLQGIKNITPDKIFNQLADPNVPALGIVIDADSSASDQWQEICQTCQSVEQLRSISFPNQIPENGFICSVSDDQKFGIWMMPDNRSPGMLETLLSQLIPNDREDLWTHLQNSVSQAKPLGATFDDKHLDKAHIYTWLAWHHKPGAWLKTGERAVFNFDHPQVHAFVDWLKTLYDL